MNYLKFNNSTGVKTSLLLAILVSTLSIISWVSDANSDNRLTWETELVDSQSIEVSLDTAKFSYGIIALIPQLAQVLHTNRNLRHFQSLVSHQAKQYHQIIFKELVFAELQSRFLLSSQTNFLSQFQEV